MQRLQSQNIFLIFTSLIVGVLLTACELVETKPDIESSQKKSAKKVTTPDTTAPDISKLSLEEIHKLPHNRACKKLLARAKLKLKIRPEARVKVKAIKGMSKELDLDNMFYLEPEVEKYPQDDSIRSYKCPDKLEDVKVTYNLKKGPAYNKWYHYSYHGNLKGIDVSSSSGPGGQIETRFGDEPPEITFQIDKIEVVSLKPLHTFSNDDVSFRINNIVFDSQKNVSFQFFNKSNESLAVRKFEVILGPKVFEVDFKNNIVHLTQYQMHKMNDIEVGINKKKWYVVNGNKAVRFMVKLLYKSGRQIKKLSVENYIRVKDLGINK